jgi:hypothetical protein
MAQKEIVLEEDISGPGGEAEKDGWLVHKLIIAGKRGSPDRWHFKKGELVIIEYKKIGESLSGNQVKRIRELREHGHKVHVCETHDEARRALRLGEYA